MVSRKVAVVLEGNDMIVELTTVQLQQILDGRVSMPQRCGELESIAIAHAYLKYIGRRAADQFTVTRPNWWPRRVGGPRLNEPQTAIGPCARLDRDYCRFMLTRQSVTTTIGTRVPVFISIVYDRYNIAFVDVEGRCLYVQRSQIIDQWTLPNVNSFSKAIGTAGAYESDDDDESMEGIDEVDARN